LKEPADRKFGDFLYPEDAIIEQATPDIGAADFGD
jgi:hypothetical protein